MREYQMCSSCVMDTTDSLISFDENGVCDHCRNYHTQILPTWDTGKMGWKKLQPIVERIRSEGRDKDFDCILGISGGIDSSYLTYLVKEIIGLRPLVFHVDAGWNSRLAVNNIEKLVKKLNLNLFTVVIDWEEMRDLQLAFFKSGVPYIDIPQDHAFFATMYNFAEKHKIKHILTGANHSTECVRNPLEWVYYASDVTMIKDIHSKFGANPLKRFPLNNILNHKVYLRYVKGVKVVSPLNYFPYIKKDAIQLLSEKFDWEEYPQKHFESIFTKFYEGYWLPKKFGFDTRKVQFSSLILTGQMTRQEALEKLSTPPYDAKTIKMDFEYIAKKLKITTDELQGYLDSPNKSFRDYRSQERIFIMGNRVMNLLGSEKRTIR